MKLIVYFNCQENFCSNKEVRVRASDPGAAPDQKDAFLPFFRN